MWRSIWCATGIGRPDAGAAPLRQKRQTRESSAKADLLPGTDPVADRSGGGVGRSGAPAMPRYGRGDADASMALLFADAISAETCGAAPALASRTHEIVTLLVSAASG